MTEGKLPAAKPLPAHLRRHAGAAAAGREIRLPEHPRRRLQRQAQLAFDEGLQRAAAAQPPRHSYPELVPKVDADGNDIGGVRSYMLQVPLGTYTGWNHRRAGFMEDDLCGLQGSYIPFAKTPADRGADPRPSLQERYGSHANYVAKVEAAARNW